MASGKSTKDTDAPAQNQRLNEESWFLLNDFGDTSNAMEIFSELFENKAITFFLNNTFVTENIDTEVHARDFIHNLRRKNCSFDPRFSIILKTLNLPQSDMTTLYL